MISIEGLEILKKIAELESDNISGGVLYLIIENDEFTWRKASQDFDLELFQIGEKLKSNSIAGRAMREKRTIVENVPRSLYGIRLRTIAEPLVNENGEIAGAFSIVFPRLHPVAKAFGDFAPALAEMFPEGAVIYMTDLEKIAYMQHSKKFNVPSVKLGNRLDENFIAARVIKEKRAIAEEISSDKYGVPVMVTCYPIFDDEGNGEIVATLGIVTPKELAANLRGMSDNLAEGVTGISSALQQLAASASEIHNNEQELNNKINQIITVSEEINQISVFIKKIADETNMLGLNAAIEAARAGDIGRGFGVVAAQIRKLSEQSKSTVPKINTLTDLIKATVNESSKMSLGSLSSSQEQAAAAEEITSNIEEITSLAEELNSIARRI